MADGPVVTRPGSGRGVLLSVLALALVVRAVTAWQLHGHPLLRPVGRLDSGVYVALARRVAEGDLLLRGVADGAPFFVAPLYLYFLAVPLALGGSLVAAKALQAALGTLAVGLLYAAARPWLGRPAALAAAGLVALTGPVVFHEAILLQAALDPFLMALGLLAVSRGLRSDRFVDWALAGAAIGLFTLNRPNAILWGVGLATALPLARGLARGGKGAVALALGLVLGVTPATARNLAVSGEPVLVSSHGGLNFYIGNRAEADGTYRRVPGITPDVEGQAGDARRVAEAARGQRLSAREVDAYFRGLAWDWIRAQPAEAGQLFLRKLAYVFASPEISLNYSYAYYARDEPTLLGWLAVGAWLLVPLGLLGFVDRLASGEREDPPRAQDRGGFALWALAVPAYAVSVAAFFVSARYRLPLFVPLAAGAGFALVRLAEAVRARAGRRLAAYASLGLLLFGLALWPHHLDDGRAEERTVMLLWLADNGQAEEALRRLPGVEAAHPEPARLLLRLGQALSEAGRAEAAARLLERSLDLDPSRTETRLALVQALTAAGAEEEATAQLERFLSLPRADAASLLSVGTTALQLGRPDLALRLLEAGIALDPRMAALRERRGLTLVMLGRSAEARPELEEAHRLDPGSASAALNLAVLEAQEGRIEEARALTREALRLQPDYPQARGLLEVLDRVR